MPNPAIPDSLKAIRGTLKKSRVNQAQPKLDPAFLPPPPDDLAADEKAVWIRLAAVIDPMRVATAADVECFAVLVYSVALAHRIRKSRKAGTVEKVTAWKHARSAMTDFGISPSSRAKVSAAPASSKADPLAEFLS
jgi:hypothetical protein